jgi:hypothetical protein
MNKKLSQINLQFTSFDSDEIENEIKTKLLTRFTECEVIFDLTKLNHVFALVRHTGKIKRIFENYREHGDKIIRKTIVLVRSKGAKLIANIFLKIANPSCPTSIQISKHE